MYDAAVAQVIYHYNNEQLGGFSGTVVKMLEADPHFAMGNILQLVLDSFGMFLEYLYLLILHNISNSHEPGQEPGAS